MTKKLDKEHLEAITQLRNDFTQNANLLGTVTIEEHSLKEQLKTIESHREQLLSQFQQLRTRETELIESLKERYGDGSINIEEGTFTSAD